MSFLQSIPIKAGLITALVVATLMPQSPAFAAGDTTTVFRFNLLPSDKCTPYPPPFPNAIDPPLMIKCPNYIVQACAEAGGVLASQAGKTGCAMQASRAAKYDIEIRRGATGPYNPIPRENGLAAPSRPGGCVLRPVDKGNCGPKM